MNDDDDIFRKSAGQQRMYMILCAILLSQVVFMGVLFALGLFESNRVVIRWVVGIELVVALGVYSYFRLKGSSPKPPKGMRRR